MRRSQVTCLDLRRRQFDRMIAVADHLVRARAILGDDVSRPVWAQVVAS